ncbi:hypothetical protein GOP47_0000774 [Adiantum capillus-veneris]|uniref:Uncharacterized protein n=1 Tax=Adiantum capillus-veneris TaxID=13818 RepID=A0A9D4VEK7_ADICA|nr:hypothetical protein GOP47_0000774 [Adiantum capillus-veneris]
MSLASLHTVGGWVGVARIRSEGIEVYNEKVGTRRRREAKHEFCNVVELGDRGHAMGVQMEKVRWLDMSLLKEEGMGKPCLDGHVEVCRGNTFAWLYSR